ncbi:hypothetical protein FNF31_05654 [Cafeteria roenbergensis]|uniref:TRP C-terminal domain-containing protein n=1 Tax=Cafeteria roenbergensis TaxID=33653 RepID=A0A5A8CY06_CAFRO|nr:hypothetical protein FNF31_05654 [Cafeteria roenbergensis]
MVVVYFFLCYQAIIVAVAATWRFSPALSEGTFLSNDFSVLAFFPASGGGQGLGPPTPEFVAMAAASAVAGLVWGILAPAVAVYWLFRHRKRLLEQSVQDRFGLFLDGFKLGLQNDGLDFMLGRTSTLLASNLMTEVSAADLQRDLQDFLVVENPRGSARSRLVTIQQTLSSEALGKSSFRVRHMLAAFAERMYADNSWWWPIFLLASRTALVLLNVATTNDLASRAFWGAVVVVALALAHTMVQPYAAKAAGLAESLTLVTQGVAAVLSLFFFAFDWDSPTIKSLTILGSIELRVVSAATAVAQVTAAMQIAGVTVMAGNAAVQLVMVAFNALRPGEPIVQEEQTQVVASETLSWWLSSLMACLTCSDRWTKLPEADPEASGSAGDATVVYCCGPLQCKSQRRMWQWCALGCFCQCWCQRPEPLSAKSVLGTVTKAKLLSQYMVRHSKSEAGEVSRMFYNEGVAAAAAVS